jgi:hypothetical protein
LVRVATGSEFSVGWSEGFREALSVFFIRVFSFVDMLAG